MNALVTYSEFSFSLVFPFPAATSPNIHPTLTKMSLLSRAEAWDKALGKKKKKNANPKSFCLESFWEIRFWRRGSFGSRQLKGGEGTGAALAAGALLGEPSWVAQTAGTSCPNRPAGRAGSDHGLRSAALVAVLSVIRNGSGRARQGARLRSGLGDGINEQSMPPHRSLRYRFPHRAPTKGEK